MSIIQITTGGVLTVSGSKIFHGTDIPASNLGTNDDTYFRANGDVYVKESNIWNLKSNVKGVKGDTGDTGAPGANGKTILPTTGAPASNLGTTGDYAVDITNSMVYGPKTNSTTWPVGVSFKGATGNAGTNGKTILSTSGVPASNLGTTGDYALDTTNNIIYGPKTSPTVWPTSGFSFRGTAGNPGADGKSAYQLWLDSGNTGTATDFLNSLKGAAGTAGVAGEVRYLPNERDSLWLSVRSATNNQLLKYGYKNDDLTGSGVKMALIGDSQGTGSFQTTGKSIEARIKAVYPNLTVTNYCVSGYNSRRLTPNGSNAYVDTNKNITKALADGNTIIIVIDTSNDSDSTNSAGGEVPILEWQNNLELIDQAALIAGADIFYVSTFPRPQLNTTAQQKQKDMAAYYLRRFGNRCIYSYYAVADPANDLNLNSLYQTGDNIHLNDAGAGVVFNILNATLQYHYSTLPAKTSLYEVFNSNAYAGIFVKFQTTTSNLLSIPKDTNYYKVRPIYVDGFVGQYTNIVQGLATTVPTNIPPTVNAGNNQTITLPTSNITLTALASDADGNIISYLWTKTAGPDGTQGVGFNNGSFTPLRTFNVVPDGNGELYIDNTSGTYQPGDLIQMEGNFTAVTLINLQGSVANPIVFRNKPGTICKIGNKTFAGSGKFYALSANNCRNFIFAGESPTNFIVNGSEVDTISPGGEPWRSAYRNISMDALTENFEFCYMTVTKGGTSIVGKTDPTTNTQTQYPNRELGYMKFHDMIVSDPYNEFFYLGHTATYWNLTANAPYYGTLGNTSEGWVSGNVYVQPILVNGPQVDNCLLTNGGKDGIQIAAAKNIKVRRNEVTGWANQQNAAHNGGILIGGRTESSEVTDNYVHDAWGECFQFYGTTQAHVFNNNLLAVNQGDMVSMAGRSSTQGYAQVSMNNNTFVRSGATGNLVRVNGYYNKVSGADVIQAILKKNILAAPHNNSGSNIFDSYYVYTENPLDTTYTKIVTFPTAGVDANVRYATLATANLDANNYYLPNNGSVTQGFRKTATLGPTTPGSTNSPIITTPAAASTTVTGLDVAGTYTFRCTVTDNSNLTAYDDVDIVVQNAGSNQPPTVNVGGDQTITSPTSEVSVSATASDPDGTIASYAWSKVSGPAAGTITSSTAATTTITGLTLPGTYVYGCTVTDNNGLTANDTVVITVNSSTVQLSKWKFNDGSPTQIISGWNEVTGGGLNVNNYNVSWADGGGSGLTLVHLVTNSTTATQKWGPVYYQDNASHGNSDPAAPNFAKDGWWSYQRYYVDQATSSQFKVTGCVVGGTYRVRLYSSLATSFGLDSSPTRLIVNGNTGTQVDRNADGNNLADSTKWAEITNVSPNASGEIFIAVVAVSGLSQFGMINALEVEKTS